MLEKDTARSAATKPKGKAEAGGRARKKTVTTPAVRTGGGEPAALKGRTDDMYERIQRRAYELWEHEGCPAGREQAHWLQAESEIATARSRRVAVSR